MSRIDSPGTAGAVRAGAAMAQADKGTWTTPWAEKLGVALEMSFDSGGADACNPNRRPLVFITSEGPGYGGLLSGRKLPGLAIIDGDSKRSVASREYNVLGRGWKNVFEPHGLGVSSEGKWIYLPTGEGSFGSKDHGRLLIINARTLKIDKVLRLKSNPHHVKAFHDADGKALVLVESFRGGYQPTFILDPADDNKVVGGWTRAELGNRSSYSSFVSPDGKEVFVGAGSHHSPPKSLKDRPHTAVVRIDTRTWQPLGKAIPVAVAPHVP